MNTTLALPKLDAPTLPNGWLEKRVAPLILEAQNGEKLEQYERELKAAADLLEQQPLARIEIEKALRIVDCRKGELFGEAKHGGDRSEQVCRDKLEPGLVHRCRAIAKHWKTLWPHILKAVNEREVTRAAVLRMIKTTPKKKRRAKAPKRQKGESQEHSFHRWLKNRAEDAVDSANFDFCDDAWEQFTITQKDIAAAEQVAEAWSKFASFLKKLSSGKAP